MAGDDWKKLPDVEPEKSDWKSLPDIDPGADTGVAGSPLESALKSQSGDVVTVPTPTGPAQFDRQGRRVLTGAEAAQAGAGASAKLKEDMLGAALSFTSGGGKLMDELAGVDAAIKAPFQGMTPASAYTQVRDRVRGDVARATKQTSPTLNIGSAKVDVLPAVGSMVPFLGAPAAASALGRIGTAAFGAGLDELGGSEESDPTELLKDVASSTGAGALSAGLFEGLGAPVRWAAGKARSEAGAAADVVRAGIQRLRDKAQASALGKLGSIGAQQMNVAEHAMQILNNPALYQPGEVTAAQAFVASPEGAEVMRRAAVNALAKGGSLTGMENAARTALTDATAAAQPGAVASEAAAKLEPGAVVSDLAGKGMKSIGQRALLGAGGAALGAGVAALSGNDPLRGAEIGAGGGLIAPGALQFLRNTAASPVVQSVANRAAAGVFEAGANAGSRVGQTMVPALRSLSPSAPTQPDSPSPADRNEEDAIAAFLHGG